MTVPDIEVIEQIDEQIKVHIPNMFKVILHNDNTTTIDFVIHILTHIFHRTQEDALVITLAIHEKGEGIAGGPYTKEIAEEKVLETISSARANNYPLMATFEEI